MRWTVSSSFVVGVCPHVAVCSTHPASILSHCRAAETTFSNDHWTHSQHWTRGTCRLNSRPADLSCRSRTHQWSQTLATSVCFNCAISPMVERYFYMSPLCRCRQQQTNWSHVECCLANLEIWKLTEVRNMPSKCQKKTLFGVNFNFGATPVFSWLLQVTFYSFLKDLLLICERFSTVTYTALVALTVMQYVLDVGKAAW